MSRSRGCELTRRQRDRVKEEVKEEEEERRRTRRDDGKKKGKERKGKNLDVGKVRTLDRDKEKRWSDTVVVLRL